METKNLSLETQPCLIQSKINMGKILEIPTKEFPVDSLSSMNGITISNSRHSTSRFIAAFNAIRYQKWFVYINLSIHNYRETFVMMVDSSANDSVIIDGVILTKF